MPPNAVDGILHDLANLQLGDRRVLGDRNADGNKPRGHAHRLPSNVIVISDGDDDENTGPANPPSGTRMTKAMHLLKIARTVNDAHDNEQLATAFGEFVDLLHASRSRTLTKEGFAVLDALYKQLADPSVYIQPLRTSRMSSSEDARAPEPRYVKMNKLLQLRLSVAQAADNRALAQMVAEFGAVINRSNGRTLTKDAFHFLGSVADRLRTLA